MKKVVLSLILVFLGIAVFKSITGGKRFINWSFTDKVVEKPSPDFMRLKSYSQKAKSFCRAKNMNTDFFLLADLSIHSGVYRFFIWDFNKDSIANSFLVSHGCCDNPWAGDDSKENARCTNEDGSHCSSVGRYIIGERGYSQWGINVKYLLHGIDSTNRNAMKRQIVLHGWDAVSDEEVFPNGAPEGWGCPALFNNSMTIIDSKLKNVDKKVLLWMIQ